MRASLRALANENRAGLGGRARRSCARGCLPAQLIAEHDDIRGGLNPKSDPIARKPDDGHHDGGDFARPDNND